MRRIFVLSIGVAALACGGDGGHGATQPPAPAPAISLSPGAAAFSATAGASSPAPQSVAITNSGTGTLGSLAVGAIVYGSGQPGGWLNAALTTTTAPATMTLAPATAGLAVGTYTAVVPIASGSAGVTNSPQAVNLTLTVLPVTAASVTLASAGQSTAFLTSPRFSASLTVQPGSQYLVAVVNTNVLYALQEGFSLSGTFGASVSAGRAGGPVAMPSAPAAAQPAPRYEVGGALPVAAAGGGSLTNHEGMLEDNRRIFARFGNPAAVWALARSRAGAQAGRSAPLGAGITPTVGAVSKVYVKHSLSGSCTAVDSIGARTVAVGQHVIVLADTNRTTWPQSLRPDSSFYQSFASEYDQITFPHIVAKIGDPLAYDAALSGAGRITVTITPVLNNFAGASGGGSIVAFVNGCDFFPLASSGADADFSNQTEMFYSWIPGTSGFTVPIWEDALRATAAHETKHIVSYTDRIINNSTAFEEIWLEEGLAQESSEIWERNFNQATWLGHATFLQTVACELSLGLTCDPNNTKPYALLGSHLPFFFDYLQTESTSNGEGLGLDTPANYGAGWTFARWATDQYAAGNEAAFIKSLINEPRLTGLANLSLHTGQSVPLLLVYWNLATAIFQTPAYTAADVRTTIPSFNFADIFNVGQTRLTCNGTPCGLFTNSGAPVYPVQPIAVPAAGSFSRTVNGVPGTAASFFLLGAAGGGTETLQLTTPGGAPLASSSGLRVAILRVQ